MKKRRENKMVDAMLDELQKRKGFEEWLSGVDGDVQQEIYDALVNRIKSVQNNEPKPDFMLTFGYDGESLLAEIDGTLATAEVIWDGTGLWKNNETGQLMAGEPAAALLLLGNIFMMNMKSMPSFQEAIVQRTLKQGAYGGPKHVREMWSKVIAATRFR
jgi:hypothetical protein